MALRFVTGASALALIVAACSSGPGDTRDPASTQPGIETGGSAGTARSTDGAKAGAGSRASTKPSSNSTGGSTANAEDPDAPIEAAGMGGAAGEASEPPPPCDLEGSCSSDGDGAKVTCGVEPWFHCEFNAFVGATAQVGWGQHAVIGTACCGACECVPVEVYFDGAHCWQGIPQCDIALFNPHATTVPNPEFTVPADLPGTFYLGSGGNGGSGGFGGFGGSSTANGGAGAGGGSDVAGSTGVTP